MLDWIADYTAELGMGIDVHRNSRSRSAYFTLGPADKHLAPQQRQAPLA
jgi:hypothetical protein